MIIPCVSVDECPERYELLDSRCFYFAHYKDTRTFDEAQNICVNDYHGGLASVKSGELLQKLIDRYGEIIEGTEWESKYDYDQLY